MGRKKSYDRDVLIAKAMDLFREHGFGGTSTEMLVAKLGVNRYSIYAEFGSKQALFDAALERYEQEVIDKSFGPLRARDAGLAEIRQLFEFYAAAAHGPASGKGCLLCNTAVELGTSDPGGGGHVQKYFTSLTTSFAVALLNTHQARALASDLDIRQEAHFLTASALGIFVMLRAKAAPEMIESAASVIIRHLDGLR